MLRPEQRITVRLLTSTGEPTLEAFKTAYRYDAVPVATREDPGDTFMEVRGSLNNQFGIGSYWESGWADVSNQGVGMIGIVTLHEDAPG